MIRTALIALALCLVYLAPARAAPGAAPAPQTARPLVIYYPTTFICVPAAHPAKTGAPSESPGEQRQPIPPGKPVEDLCPPGAHARLFFDTSPFPWVSGLSPPLFPKAAGPAPPQPAHGAKTP